MKEQAILQCARCLNHTPLIETSNGEEIAEAIKRHKRCEHCGHYVMLCFESKAVPVCKGKVLSWRSHGNSASGEKLRGRNPSIPRGHKVIKASLPSLRHKKNDDHSRNTSAQR